ncbi:MAG TPA: hypothetical protein VMT91_00700 [Anaerolineales bacterium]|nr:hypothetical protein [Anaerolineales bacterium]
MGQELGMRRNLLLLAAVILFILGLALLLVSWQLTSSSQTDSSLVKSAGNTQQVTIQITPTFTSTSQSATGQPLNDQQSTFPVNPSSVNESGNNQPAFQSTPAAGMANQSDAGQTEQSIDDLQSTLQFEGTSVNSVDTSQIDQILNDMENSLQSTDAPTPTPDQSDSIDQELNNLQQTLQAQAAP